MSESSSSTVSMAHEEIIIDLSSVGSFDNMLFELTGIIESGGLQGKNAKINLGDNVLDKKTMSGLQSLLKGYNINTDMIFSNSIQTKIAAIEAGLTVSGQYAEVVKPKNEEEDLLAEDKLVTAMNNVLAGNAEEQEIEKLETLYIKQTLRSGQKIEYDGNIVIIGDCKAGSEITAAGDITIWGILNGIAHAGAKGDHNSVIRAFRINAIQIRIADLLARKPDSPEIEKFDRFGHITPEEAKITNGEIVIYTING